jgi:L-lactate dehydrogenase complex protein LldF
MSTRAKVDHASAAEAFLAKLDHVTLHDRRLWDLRMKRDAQAASIDEWEALRTLASQVKEYTLSHLSTYLDQFASNAQANGIVVHWALDAQHITGSCIAFSTSAAQKRSSKASRC